VSRDQRLPASRSRRRDVSLVITCVVCGRPIELVPGAPGAAVPDREEFLRVHGRCLVATDREGMPPL
jgi:hypothetical protein